MASEPTERDKFWQDMGCFGSATLHRAHDGTETHVPLSQVDFVALEDHTAFAIRDVFEIKNISLIESPQITATEVLERQVRWWNDRTAPIREALKDRLRADYRTICKTFLPKVNQPRSERLTKKLLQKYTREVTISV